MVEHKEIQTPFIPVQEQLKPPLSSTDQTPPCSFEEGIATPLTTPEELPEYSDITISASSTSREEWVFRDQKNLLHGNQQIVSTGEGGTSSILHYKPIIFHKAKGTSYWDIDNVEYLDMLGGLHNNHIGHGREEIAQVAFDQMKRMEFSLNVHSFSHTSVIECAEKILSLTKLEFPSMDKVYFTSGGSEAVESAIHCAQRYWQVSTNDKKKCKIISFRNCYHGSTFLSSSLNDESSEEYGWDRMKSGETQPTSAGESSSTATTMEGQKIPQDEKGMSKSVVGGESTASLRSNKNFLTIPFPHDFVINGHEQVTRHTNNGFFIAEQLESLIKREGADTIAAFIVEPIQGNNGALEPHKDFFPLARKICDKYGILIIDDEVMSGFGKTGKWFAISNYNIEPDIVVFGKGVTSGYLPLGGMAISRDVYQNVFLNSKDQHTFLHDYTYSGHPVCCQVAIKNIDIIQQENLLPRALVMGETLRREICERLRDCPHFRGCTGMGLMLGVMLDKEISARSVKEMMVQKHHILVDASQQNDRIVILTPPLIIEEEKINFFVDCLLETLQGLKAF